MQTTLRQALQLSSLAVLAGFALTACGGAPGDGSTDESVGTLQETLRQGHHNHGKHKGHCKHDGKHGDKDALGGKHYCPTDAPGPVGVAAACGAYVGSGCGFFPGTADDCVASLSAVFNVDACAAEADAYAACAASSTVECTDRSGYTGCEPILSALDACLAANQL